MANTIQFRRGTGATGSDYEPAEGEPVFDTGTGKLYIGPSGGGTDLSTLTAINSGSASSLAADNLTAGDAAITLTTTTGNITIDAQAGDSDIIFKGTDGSSDTTFLTIDGSEAGHATFNNKVTATGFVIGSADIAEAELEILDGASVTTAELNILDGVTASTAELNIMDGVTATTAELNIMDGVTATTAELNIMDGVTATATELNLIDGVTATTAELNILDGVTSTAAELNLLDGTVSSTELGYLDGAASGTSAVSKCVVLDSNGDYEMQDSDKIWFGTGADMELMHDGTNSYIKNKTGALKIATETSGIAVTIGHTTSEVTVADNLTVTGDLTVSGATTTVNTATMTVEDHNIVLGSGNSGSEVADATGLTLEGCLLYTSDAADE